MSDRGLCSKRDGGYIKMGMCCRRYGRSGMNLVGVAVAKSLSSVMGGGGDRRVEAEAIAVFWG